MVKVDFDDVTNAARTEIEYTFALFMAIALVPIYWFNVKPVCFVMNCLKLK